MDDKKFPVGMRVWPPHKNAPEFVKGNVQINVYELTQWLKANADEKNEVRLDLKEGKSGALYMQLNTYKKQDNQAPADDVPVVPF